MKPIGKGRKYNKVKGKIIYGRSEVGKWKSVVG